MSICSRKTFPRNKQSLQWRLMTLTRTSQMTTRCLHQSLTMISHIQGPLYKIVAATLTILLRLRNKPSTRAHQSKQLLTRNQFITRLLTMKGTTQVAILPFQSPQRLARLWRKVLAMLLSRSIQTKARQHKLVLTIIRILALLIMLHLPSLQHNRVSMTIHTLLPLRKGSPRYMFPRPLPMNNPTICIYL